MCLSTDSRYVLLIRLNFHFSSPFLFLLVSKDTFTRFMYQRVGASMLSIKRNMKRKGCRFFVTSATIQNILTCINTHFLFLHHFPVKIYLAAGCLVHIYLLYCIIFLSFNFFTSYFSTVSLSSSSYLFFHFDYISVYINIQSQSNAKRNFML